MPCACTDPPLSTVRQPIEAMGRAAVTLLINQIEGGMTMARELLTRERDRLDTGLVDAILGAKQKDDAAISKQRARVEEL